MLNSFFADSLDQDTVRRRILDLEDGRVGFYSIGLYPASLAYNSAMHGGGDRLLLAPRPGRSLFGAFTPRDLSGMDPLHVATMEKMLQHEHDGQLRPNSLRTLIERCDLVVLTANSNHIEQDLHEACELRRELGREQVVMACLAGSFSHDPLRNDSYVLCERQPNLAFFSGFHRHGALRDPVDSFTANFCHPNGITAMIGARLMDRLSPNIQVSPGVHNVEAQYIKAAKNISSIFAGFGYTFHAENTGILPTLLTLLLDQCLDQASSVSMRRRDRQRLYGRQPFPLTELGYGVQRIEATLSRGGEMEKVRDHTFTQLTAMVADVRGSMMLPVCGKPTRNFQAGQILAEGMRKLGRCPVDVDEFEQWCEQSGVKKGGLEGLKALRYWPQILVNYGIQVHDASMVNLLYMAIFGKSDTKAIAFRVMTESRELSNYCQESVRPSHSRRYSEALQSLERPESLDLLANAVVADNARRAIPDDGNADDGSSSEEIPAYLRAMNVIENVW
ncbi:hypothetical protein IQ216_06700 [Cyanobium sp. LEGE 06143]|uniref:hypothetical protein n=1 Tax=unclassified Cyanobium TaxID=2627006 RepID=UPI00187EBF78|nr:MULTISPECIES: hypothetical protein [unclassified Cyanobium]MBE9154047.1 hypothetical protein [Cyanobium sp. LEGE 06113]MBE9172780.1 hypothetical protein [Cyanobium sp. LEGE 06143]